jgi:ABC-type transport system involved in multi-copper enzyme maturation permease subunit
MSANLVAIARLEFLSAARLKWIRLLTAAFALLAIAAAYSAGSAQEVSGADGFARTTLTLVPVALILVPLAALLLGVSGQTVEAGHDVFLFGQPVARATIILGRWLGEAMALSGSIAGGFGLGGVLIAYTAGAEGAMGFAFFVGASLLLAVIFLSLAAAIAACTDTRVIALSVGTFAWFFFVLLYDAAALALAGWLTGLAGGRVLFASVFGNPADLIRVAMLSVSGTPHVLGAAGEAWLRFLGGASAAAVACAGVLALWTVAPLVVAVRAIGARDL